MQTFYQLLSVVAAGLIVWFLYRSIKNNPQVFSRENFSKSFSAMGVLALLLIAFIAFLVLMLRYT